MPADLFCSIYVDSPLDRAAMAAHVAELTGGRSDGRRVEAPWARIVVDDDYGDFEIRTRDPEDFLGWRVLLEVMPSDAVAADHVVAEVAALMRALVANGMAVLGQADYAERLPGAGEVVRPG